MLPPPPVDKCIKYYDIQVLWLASYTLRQIKPTHLGHEQDPVIFATRGEVKSIKNGARTWY